jgi:hypothetical protein
MLPVMSVGGTPLAGNGNPGVSTPVVDEVQKLVGGVATIFQRVNKQGDMLRVATNVIGKTGKRAVGTYIPATNPDGSPNPVVSTLMNGETYNGMAFVVDQWYVTAYEPIRDGGGNVVGALFVGIKQENVASLRKAIEGTTIGKTGYIWVLGGKGDVSGHYIISKDGKRNGEDITDIQDADGKYPIREIVSKGVNLRPGESFVYSYMWKDNKSAEPRKKVAAVTYYEPWDWLIGASCYEDEAMSAAQTIKSSARRMLLILGITGILAALGAGYAFKEMLRKPMSKITLITTVTEALTRGDIGRADELMGSMNDKVA